MNCPSTYMSAAVARPPARDGVVVVDRAGRRIDRIHVLDEQWTANASFGGTDGHTLFITASTGLYAVRMRVTGANAAK